MRAAVAIASTTLVRSPFSTKAREVSTSETLAIPQAAMRFAAPAVKFSIAGTRPAACSAMKVTAEPLAFGRSTPTVSPGCRDGGDLARQHRDADAEHAQAQGAAQRVLNRRRP